MPRTEQGRQREPCVKTLRSPLSAEFWRLSAACHFFNVNINVNKYLKSRVRLPLEATKYLFIFSFLRSGVQAKRGVEFRHSHFVPLRHDWFEFLYKANTKFESIIASICYICRLWVRSPIGSENYFHFASLIRQSGALSNHIRHALS